MCVWILTVWIQLQFVFFVFSAQDIDKDIIDGYLESSNSQVPNQNKDEDKEHKQENIKNTSMINMVSEHNTTIQMKPIAGVRDSLKGGERNAKINEVMNKTNYINNNGSVNSYKYNTAITTKSKQDVIERRRQVLNDFLSKTSKEDTRYSMLQLRRAFDPSPNFNDVDNNDDIDPDLLEMDLDKDYTIPTYPPAKYALNRSFFYDRNYSKESIGKKLWQKVNVDSKKLVPEPAVIVDDKHSNKQNTSNTSNPTEGIEKVLRSGNNNMFDNIGNENMDISAESSSYVYPKEYIFEVLQSPGIPEAVNFRTRTTEVIEGEPYFMTTLTNMFDIIDPEIFNMDKKPTQHSAPNQKNLVPDPRKVTYPTITTTTKRNLDYDFFENGVFSPGPTQFHFNNFQTHPNRDLTTSDKVSNGTYNFEPISKVTSRKLNDVSPSTTTTSTAQGFFSIEPVYKTKTRKRTAVLTSSTQTTKKLFNFTTKPLTNTTASVTIKSNKHNLPYEHKQPSVPNTYTVSVPATMLIQKQATTPETNKKYSKADNPTITIWSVTVITNTMNPKGHWWTPSLNATADPFLVNYDALPEQESTTTTTTTTAQPYSYYYQTKTRARNMGSKRHFEPYTKPGITRKPSSLKKKWEEERKRMSEGHFTFFVYKFMREITVKEPPKAAKELTDEFLPAINEWYTARPTLRKLGEPFTMGLIQFFTNIQNETPESLREMASTFGKALKMRHNVFTIEFNYLFDAMDKMYTPEEKDKMLDVLEEVKDYPDTPKNSRQIIKSLIDEAFVKPFHRLGPTKRRHQFVESLNIYISYTYYDGKHIFIPENAIRRKMENDAEVRNRKAFDLEQIKMNEKLFMRTLRKQLANSTNEDGENYSDASQNTVEDPVEELKVNIHSKRVTKHLIQLRNSGLQFNSFAGNKLRVKSPVTRKQKQSKIFAIGPNPHLDHSKTSKKYLKKNPEKYDLLSIENSEYLKSITIFEPDDKLSILRNDKQSKHFKEKNITRHKDKLSTSHNNKNIKYINKNIPKQKDYVSLSSDEDSNPPKELVKKIKKFGDLIFHSHKNKKVNKKVSPNPVKIIKHNTLKTKSKQILSTFQPPKEVKSAYNTSKNIQRIRKNKKNVRKKPIHGKRYTVKTAFKKMSPKEKKSQGNETRETKRIKLMSIKTKKNRSKMIGRQASYKKAKLGRKFSTIRHETNKKRFFRFKEHIKIKFRDHNTNSNKTEMRASNSTVNLTSLTNLENIKSQYLRNDVPSKMSRLTTRDDSYYYWHPPENYDDVSLRSETQEHFAAARDKQVNEEFKDYGNTMLSAENKHGGIKYAARDKQVNEEFKEYGNTMLSAENKHGGVKYAARERQVNEEFKDYSNTMLSAENKHGGVKYAARDKQVNEEFKDYSNTMLSAENKHGGVKYAARDKQVNEEFKEYGNTMLSAENRHDGVFKSTRLETHIKVKTNTAKPTTLSMPTTLGVPAAWSTQSTLSIPTTLGMLRTPSKIVKQFQVEIMKTKVPDKDVLRKRDKTLNKYIADQDLASYKYLHKNEDVIYSYLRSKPPPVWIPNDKTRFTKNTFHDRKLEVFDVNDNTESSGSSSECDGRCKADYRNVRKDKILEKIKFESSYSDYETNLRVSLNDAFIHGLDEGLYRRTMNADIDKEHEELNSKLLLPASESDEEMLLKSNIYKSLRHDNKNNTRVTKKK